MKSESEGAENEHEKRKLKAECPLGIQAVPCQIQKQAFLALSRLSLASYFIPFVTGTGTELQRRLQWAHQSTPTDCGPTDTLEVGINFFVENVEKAATMCWNNSMFGTLVFSCLLVVSAALLSSQALCMSKVARVRMTPCFRQMFVWGGFRPFPVFRLFFFSFPLSPTPLTSSPWVQPTWLWAKINAHMCLQLLFTVLMKVRKERDRWENLNQLITDKIF